MKCIDEAHTFLHTNITGTHSSLGWMIRGSNPGGGGQDFPHPLWGPSSLLYNGYRVFPRSNAAKAWH